MPEPPHASAEQVLQAPYWVAGQVTMGVLQLRNSNVVNGPPHVPLEQEYDVTERYSVPVPPHALAVQPLQAP